MEEFIDYSQLYVGAEVCVDYRATGKLDLIDLFEEESNLEGYGRIESFDESYIKLENYSYRIQLEYINLIS